MAVQTILNYRTGLTNTRNRLKKGQVTVGFLGGSITQASPGHNWPEAVMNWLVETFPTCRFTVENAAIGATGSALAVFRAERDIIQRNEAGMYKLELVAGDLRPGKHKLSLEVIHGNKAFCNGTNFRLASIGIIR